MAQLKFGSAGVSATEIDLSGPVSVKPTGVPAGVIGTALKGPAFVPITVGIVDDFYAKFGLTDGTKFGPLAATEWLRNAQALTYLRVLGCGDGNRRSTQTGIVNEGGFTVGEQEPDSTNDGQLDDNPYAVSHGPMGRTYFLGAFMSESLGSTVFSSAGTQPSSAAIPIIRAVIMAASGVIPTLSSSLPGVYSNSVPSSTAVATDLNGASVGDVVLMGNGSAKQDFVVLLNGLKGTDPLYPNVLTASFDITSPNYFPNVLNTDPTKFQQAGHYVYASWEVHPATAAVTGSGVINTGIGADTAGGVEPAAFILTGSQARHVGTDAVPDYEDFCDRFGHATSPWVISQPFGGKPHNLFKVHALDDGAGVSTLYKLSIENIALSTDSANQYPTFDLVIRAWGDNDSAPNYLEQWRGLTLNPSDNRYIVRIIGDQNAYFDFDRGPTAQKIVVDGNYANASNYVRIEIDQSVDAGELDPTAMPVGCRGVGHIVTAGTGSLAAPVNSDGTWSNGFTGTLMVPHLTSSMVFASTVVSPLPMRQNLVQGTGTKKQANPYLYWGPQFEHVTSLTTPNLSTQHNYSMDAFAKFFPSHRIDAQDFFVVDNNGAPTVSGAVVDADLFNLDLFSLMNIKIVTGSAGTADPNQWVNATYVRNGNITVNDTTATRALDTQDFIQANRRFLKWTFMMQGGFDGVNIFDLDESRLDSAAVEADMEATNRNFNNGATVSAYNKALQIMGEVTNTDLQLLVIPGIRHPVVTDAAVNAVTNRFDALYIMDIEQQDQDGNSITSDEQLPSVTQTTNNFVSRALNSSFAAAYFPDVIMPDPNTGTNVVVPPSVAVLGALALNDAVGYPWFAPAGFTRGALQTTLEARVKLSKPNMDVLYDANINPIVAFPGNATGGTNPKGGVVIWGQKTLQQAATALDRVNVRRLLIELRRQVRDITMTIIFEPNRDATLAKFSAAVTPRLQRIQALAGLQRFKVIIDSSTTTQLDVENNTIRGRIYVQPTKTIEYVSLDFVVSNSLNQQV